MATISQIKRGTFLATPTNNHLFPPEEGLAYCIAFVAVRCQSSNPFAANDNKLVHIPNLE
ncbi:hypothetical protein NQ315_017105 [Exocentrus adspersus]|uniref:Uncharacterized protein n=1 Tax=Exocentrus adspersus TaxID=1586481 RepID=A0AAV8VH66_9CUCU|nr:hypothetical protein NQ315_017105 [Exocentrus adspersus]